MAPQFPVASTSRARTKKEDPLARCFSKAEPGRRKGGSGADIGGSRARQRASSVLGGPGAGDSDKEESIDFQSDDDSICCGEVRSFGKLGVGNGGSFGSEDDHYAQNLSRKNTPSVTEDPEADLSSGYLTSSTERSSTEADDSSDEDYVAYVTVKLEHRHGDFSELRRL